MRKIEYKYNLMNPNNKNNTLTPVQTKYINVKYQQ